MRRTGMKIAALAAVTAMAVTACSGGTDEGTGAATSAAPGGKVELNFWTWAPGMEEIVDVWNAANPDIQVTVNTQDGGDPAVTKLLTAIQAGSGAPDIMQTEYQKVPTLVASDALADISDVVSEDLAAHYAEGVWNGVTLGTDAVYGVPQDSGPMQLYYREDIFEEMELEVPTTWDEYAELAREVREKDPTKYLGTFSANDAGWFTGLVQQAGASWWGIEGDSWTVSVADEATLKVADYWGGLVEEGAINNKPMYTPEWNAALNDGSEIAWLSAVWAPGVLAGNAGDTAGSWRMAPMPQWDTASPSTGNWGGSATSVTSQSEHPAEAVQFIEWMNSSQEGVNLLADSGLYPADIPGQAEALSDPPAFMANQEDFYELAGQTAATAGSFTFGPNVNVTYSAYNDEFAKAAEAKDAAAFRAAVESMQQITVDDLKNSGFSVAE